MRKEKTKVEKDDFLDWTEWLNEKFIRSLARVHCLSMINKGYKHGYEMKKYIKEQFDIEISTGALYPVLQWLEENGYIKGTWKYEEGKPGRKEYELTEKGINVLNISKKMFVEIFNTIMEKENKKQTS